MKNNVEMWLSENELHQKLLPIQFELLTKIFSDIGLNAKTVKKDSHYSQQTEYVSRLWQIVMI